MKHLVLILAFFIGADQTETFGQRRNDFSTLLKNIVSADSIIVVSHKQTDGFVTTDAETNKNKYPERVVEKGKVNDNIIEERKLFPDSLKYRLRKILSRPHKTNKDSIIRTCTTFIPFHAILIYNSGKVSLIDIGFACNQYLFDVGNKINQLFYLDNSKISDLARLFKKCGINVWK